MTRPQAFILAIIALLFGGGVVLFLVTSVPPHTAGNQLDTPVILLFFAGLCMACTGIGAMAALRLHRRWPGLAGVVEEPLPAVAIRQGAIFALGVVALFLLALLQVLDVFFVLVTVVLVCLIEAFVQGRQG